MLMNESLTDTIVVYVVLKKLIKDWTEWDAFKLGIIDADGNKLKKVETSEERQAWSMLDRLIYRVKWIVQKIAGKNKLATMFTAAALLKEQVSSMAKIDPDIMESCNSELTSFNHAKNEEMYKLVKETMSSQKALLLENRSSTTFEYDLRKEVTRNKDFFEEKINIERLKKCLN